MPPPRAARDRTAGQLIEELRHYHDIHAVVGDCSPEAGAWICFNPVDGNGRSNDNVTDYRYALVEVRQHGAGKAAGHHPPIGAALRGAGLQRRQKPACHRAGGRARLCRVP